MSERLCIHCGSSNVWKDATARWDSERQEWVTKDIFDNDWCEDCDAETTIINPEES